MAPLLSRPAERKSLDQIQALGVNVVYLMPVTPVGIVKTSNSPYCVRDYSVDPHLGGRHQEVVPLLCEADRHPRPFDRS